MKVYVETNPETIYSGRVKDEVKTTEIRMWFETDEEIEVLSLAHYTKQVRKEVCEIIWGGFVGLNNINGNYEYKKFEDDFRKFLDQIQGETK